MKNKASKNRLARELTYRTVIGILPILQRFASDFDVSDINLLSDLILSMSVDEFCDHKFKDSSENNLIEE